MTPITQPVLSRVRTALINAVGDRPIMLLASTDPDAPEISLVYGVYADASQFVPFTMRMDRDDLAAWPDLAEASLLMAIAVATDLPADLRWESRKNPHQ